MKKTRGMLNKKQKESAKRKKKGSNDFKKKRKRKSFKKNNDKCRTEFCKKRKNGKKDWNGNDKKLKYDYCMYIPYSTNRQNRIQVTTLRPHHLLSILLS